MTEGKDSRETVAMSTNDDGEAKRAQHQRALLHNAPKAPPREPKPGERLMTFEHGQDVYRVELRDSQPHGVETQISKTANCWPHVGSRFGRAPPTGRSRNASRF